MPGFGLAKKAADVFDANPKVEGLILDKHGIFTFGASAREAYERMIELVTLRRRAAAEAAARRCSRRAQLPQQIAPAGDVAPIMRGACSLKDDDGEGAHRRPRSSNSAPSDADPQFRQRRGACALRQAGVVTPDHVIRTKNWPLILPRAARPASSTTFKQAAQQAAVQTFVARLQATISRATTRASAAARRCSIPLPRVVLVPGLGLFGLGAQRQGRRASPPTSPKARSRPSPTPRRSAVSSRSPKPTCSTANTGRSSRPSSARAKRAAAGRPGRRRHRRRRRDRRGDRARVRGGRRRSRAARCRSRAAARDRRRRSAASAHRGRLRRDRCGLGAGGVRAGGRRRSAASTSSVSNAGAAWQGRIGEVDEAVLRKSFELNFYGHQRVAQAAVKIMLAQGTGGCLLFNVSKQAVNPGPEFRPLRPAQGGDAVPGAAIRARLRRRRHPRQRRQCRPHPLRPADRRLHRRARQGARA